MDYAREFALVEIATAALAAVERRREMQLDDGDPLWSFLASRVDENKLAAFGRYMVKPPERRGQA